MVDYPYRQRFQELCKEASDLEKLAEAQTILIRCGAIGYGVDQLVRRYQQSRAILDSPPLDKHEQVDSLLDEVIDPIKKLFGALGMDQVSLPPSSVRLDVGTSGGSNPT